MTKHDTSFGALLRERRRALDLTQGSLADIVGCSVESIRKFEADRQRPSRDMAARLAEKLDLVSAERPLFLQLARAVARAGPPAPVAALVSGLPRPATPLVGRAAELADICARLRAADTHLLTLLGPGGAGKTRLALAVAQALADTFAHVHFVSLAAISDAELVIPTIAHALGVRERGDQRAWLALSDHLRDQHALLVLDNCEHVIRAAPHLAELRAACPRLTLLATSRVALRLRGEQEFAVAPLPPEGAVALFSARVRAVRPDFTLTDANEADVRAICARLDRLPLALELAAPRLKLLAPSALLARLAGAVFTPLDVLTSGARDLPARQQSLRATLAWSYNLLDAAEQRLFTRLAVFVGGCTLESAEQVCGAGAGEIARLPKPLLDELGALLDNSLLVQHADGDETRIGMLTLIREYAHEQLVASGEQSALRQRHAAHYCALAQQAERELRGPDQARWADRLEREHDNLRAALAWALEAGGQGTGNRGEGHKT